MIPWERLDSAEMPGGGGELRLMRRGTEFAIRLGQTELMNSRLSGSEEAMATLAAARLDDPSRARMLIGGLGMGFTLRAAQDVLGAGARIEVAELVPAVADWARGPLAPVFGDCLADARTQLRVADVRAVIRDARQSYDAILLDVDNGPEGLTRSANDALYDARGLADAFAALRPGGVLSVWSAGPDGAFTQRLRRAGFAVEEALVKADRGKRGARHVIWLAQRSGGSRILRGGAG